MDDKETQLLLAEVVETLFMVIQALQALEREGLRDAKVLKKFVVLRPRILLDTEL